ncbi:MAG: GNAT family N-acetyltransferase [Chitinophagaceae bacterium]|nr:GNAT family N-acetyltransferase [Chitinophagaceae bacterium]
MIFREADIADIGQIQFVRHAVKENRLSDPSLVTDADVEEYMTKRGRGWVCEIQNTVIGFAIVDLIENNVWALFVLPEYEAMGIGKKLHRMMMDWYFTHTKEKIWLGTEPGSRAEKFYRMQGWREAGIHGKNELKFEMDFQSWSGAPV